MKPLTSLLLLLRPGVRGTPGLRVAVNRHPKSWVNHPKSWVNHQKRRHLLITPPLPRFILCCHKLVSLHWWARLMLIMLMRANQMAASQNFLEFYGAWFSNPPSQSEIGTFFSPDRSTFGGEKVRKNEVLVPDLFGVNAKSQELSELFPGKVLRWESAYCFQRQIHCKNSKSCQVYSSNFYSEYVFTLDIRHNNWRGNNAVRYRVLFLGDASSRLCKTSYFVSQIKHVL